MCSLFFCSFHVLCVAAACLPARFPTNNPTAFLWIVSLYTSCCLALCMCLSLQILRAAAISRIGLVGIVLWGDDDDLAKRKHLTSPILAAVCKYLIRNDTKQFGNE